MEVAFLVDLAQITSDEEAVGPEFGLGLFRHSPVAGEDVGALDLYHPRLAVGQRLAAVGIGDPQRDPRQREADCTGNPVSVIRIGGVHVGFGHPVALEDEMAGLVCKCLVGFGQQRRRAGDEEAHPGGDRPR